MGENGMLKEMLILLAVIVAFIVLLLILAYTLDNTSCEGHGDLTDSMNYVCCNLCHESDKNYSHFNYTTAGEKMDIPGRPAVKCFCRGDEIAKYW